MSEETKINDCNCPPEKETPFNMHGKPEDIAKLALKITKVMGAIKDIPKGGYNKSGDYDYLQAEDCIKEVRPLLAKEGVVMFSSVGDVTIGTGKDFRSRDISKVLVKVTFRLICADTGAYIDFSYSGYAIDESDKFLYKAYTNAIKYALKNNFMLSAGSMIDVEVDPPEEDDFEVPGPDELEEIRAEKKAKKEEKTADKKELQDAIKAKKEKIAEEARQKREKQQQSVGNQEDKKLELKKTRELFAKDKNIFEDVISKYLKDGQGLEALATFDIETVKDINAEVEKLILAS